MAGSCTPRCWRWLFPTQHSVLLARLVWSITLPFSSPWGMGSTEGISMPLHHPRGPAQPASKAPEMV